MSEEMEKDQRTGISRRKILQRGAVIGGALWVSPVIQSLTNAAHADTSPPCAHYCCSCSRVGAAECHQDGVNFLPGVFTAQDCNDFCKGKGFTSYNFCHTHVAPDPNTGCANTSPYACVGNTCTGPSCTGPTPVV